VSTTGADPTGLKRASGGELFTGGLPSRGNPKKKIASIPFIRNLIEFTKGETDPQFAKLTSLLHWKADSPTITEADLNAIYNAVFGVAGASANGKRPMVDVIRDEAKACLAAGVGVNFENKIVLAIAIRMYAEKFMIGRINDSAFVAGIASHQTQTLVEKFKASFGSETKTIEVLDRVALMTPENIHLNSFMYEPIVDMSDEHLKKLYKNVMALK
jgi:hypothetical protein